LTFAFPMPYNAEVRSCFASSLVEHYIESSEETAGALNTGLSQALQKGDIEGVTNALRRFFAVIPYDIIKELENYYETAEYLLPWGGSGNRLFKIGVGFDRDKRNIGDWKAMEASH